MSGPSPADTRKIIQDLLNALCDIQTKPRDGGPATLAEARRIAHLAQLNMPMRYLPRDDEWMVVP